jgi:hypothetical protein
MKLLFSRKLLGGAALVLLLALTVSPDALGQGRGRGRGHGGFDNSDKKCGKFVNCHDARDGRWDGRGPRRNTLNDRILRRVRRNRDSDRDVNDHRRWRRYRNQRFRR